MTPSSLTNVKGHYSPGVTVRHVVLCLKKKLHYAIHESLLTITECADPKEEVICICDFYLMVPSERGVLTACMKWWEAGCDFLNICWHCALEPGIRVGALIRHHKPALCTLHTQGERDVN